MASKVRRSFVWYENSNDNVDDQSHHQRAMKGKPKGVEVERYVSLLLGKIKGGYMAANRIRSDTKVGQRCDV
jgi:hypothetical protein